MSNSLARWPARQICSQWFLRVHRQTIFGVGDFLVAKCASLNVGQKFQCTLTVWTVCQGFLNLLCTCCPTPYAVNNSFIFYIYITINSSLIYMTIYISCIAGWYLMYAMTSSILHTRDLMCSLYSWNFHIYNYKDIYWLYLTTIRRECHFVS